MVGCLLEGPLHCLACCLLIDSLFVCWLRMTSVGSDVWLVGLFSWPVALLDG